MRKAKGTSKASSTSLRIDLEGDGRGNLGHHRNDAKARAGRIGFEIAERLDVARVEADFLLRLAQGGGSGTLVARVDLAAGKGDLA